LLQEAIEKCGEGMESTKNWWIFASEGFIFPQRAQPYTVSVWLSDKPLLSNFTFYQG
jgi:hypothetical protein